MADAPPVTLDARMAGRGGIGRYILNLSRHLPEDLNLTLLSANGAALGELTSRRRVLRHEAPIYSLSEQWLGARLRWTAGAGTVFHFPHFNAPWLLPGPSVVTIHDLTHMTHADLFPPIRARAAAALISRVVGSASQVLVVSGATRTAVVERFPGAAGKLRVIYPGLDAAFRPLAPTERALFRERSGLGRYLLCVGSDRRHKNLDVLLAAFHRVRRKHRSLRLVLAGEFRDAARLSAAGATLLRPDDAQLNRLYNGAVALVSASLAEGFGLPALEAAACGTATIVSDIPAHREVLGSWGVYFDPRSEAELYSRLRDHLDRAETRPAIDLGRFDWVRAARATLDAYRHAAG